MKLKQRILKYMIEHNDKLSQSLNKTVLDEPFENEKMFSACRQAAAEGIVLLKNDGILPLSKNEETAFFGRVQNNYFYVGYGSGGDVNPPKKVSPMDAVRSRMDLTYHHPLAEKYKNWCDAHMPFEGMWAMWPTYFDEMPISKTDVEQAAKTSRTAVLFIGRAMGESMDNRAKKGYYYLTGEEKKLIDLVVRVFSKTVIVIDAGNIIDLSWTVKYGNRIGALVYAFHGGMESGNALIDILYGDVTPSGKLTDTIAISYKDYPASANFGNAKSNVYQEDIYIGYRYFETFAKDRVLYPFGFGLSYTHFDCSHSYRFKGGKCIIESSVINTGDFFGAEVIQVYVNPPQGKLGKPLRNLIAFQKTKELAPGESEMIRFEIDPSSFASFDDSGITGFPYSYVLEEGSYEILAGTDVRRAELIGSLEIPGTKAVLTLTSQAAPVNDFERIKPVVDPLGKFTLSKEPVPKRSTALKSDILEHLPMEKPYTGNCGILYSDVCSGKSTLDDFIAQLSVEELDAITRGEGEMNSSFGTAGNAGMFGGTIDSLREKGVPTIITTDGPSGIRISFHASLIPCGTALACGWNPALVEKLSVLFGEEMAQKGSDVLLGPGMNIHRDPLCGRNFEYFSEDPYLTGKMAAAVVRGIQNIPGRSACPKHFTCNNQEWMRHENDSRLSERALREIYLKGFEICVKEAGPLTLMTSYNKVNGVWAHYHYELVTNILHGEWDYQGLVITDWWMQNSVDPDFPNVSNNAYRIRSQVDVLMPGGKGHNIKEGDNSLEKSFHAPDGITLGEMQRCAKNVLKLCMALKSSY